MSGAPVGVEERGRLMRLVNDEIAQRAFTLHDLEAGEDWTFFCECGEPDCTARVWLTLDALAILRARRDSVLAAGHMRARARAARARARALSEQATALRAQAQHQQRRAARHKKPAPDENRSHEHDRSQG